MSIQGTISHWDSSKGYGYISVENQDAKILFHISDLENHSQTPCVSERVIFRLGSDHNGVVKAVQVERPIVFNFSLAIVVWFVSALIGSVVILDFPVIVCAFYLSVSTISYIVYAFDKQAMLHGGWRIPEITFHLLNIAGGWIGALIAQSVMQHKYHDIGFKLLFWLSFMMNILLFAWLLTSEGTMALHSAIYQLRAS